MTHCKHAHCIYYALERQKERGWSFNSKCRREKQDRREQERQSEEIDEESCKWSYLSNRLINIVLLRIFYLIVMLLLLCTVMLTTKWANMWSNMVICANNVVNMNDTGMFKLNLPMSGNQKLNVNVNVKMQFCKIPTAK